MPINETPCDIQINLVTTENASSADASDGKLTVSAYYGDNVVFRIKKGGVYTNWQTSPIFDNIEPGTYQVEMKRQTTFPECRVDYGVNVIVDFDECPADIVTATNSVKASGPNNSDGQVTVTTNPGTGVQVALTKLGFNSGWQSSLVFTDLEAGIYTVHGYNTQYACDKLSQKQVEVEVINNPLQVSVNKTQPLCNGASNGQATINVTGGTAPYTYSWQDGGSGQTRNNLPAGIHNLTVEDASGFKKDFQFTLDQPDSLVINVNISGASITLDVEGGTAPYNYAWADGPTTKDRSGLAAGNYQVTVTDDNGCISIEDIIIEDYDFLFADNLIDLDVSAVDPETKPNLSFRADIFVEKVYLSTNFDQVLSVEQPADDSGQTIFQVQEIVKGFLSSDLPDLTQSQVALSNSFRRFYLQYNEKYGDPPAHYPSNIVNTRYAAVGGLNEHEFAKQVFFTDYLPTIKPFLSWWPSALTKPVYPGQYEYLYFPVISLAQTELKVKVKVLYDDNATEVITPFNNVTNLNRNEIYKIPLSNSALGLYQLAKTVVQYDVWIEDQDDKVVSEVRSYRVVGSRLFFRQFLYENSLGAFDTLICTHEAKGKLKVKSNEITKTLLPGYAVSDGSVEVLEKAGYPEVKLGIYKSNQEAEHLQDFALSRKVYEVRKGYLIPVKIKCNPEFLNEDDSVNEFDFVVLDNPMNHYTPNL